MQKLQYFTFTYFNQNFGQLCNTYVTCEFLVVLHIRDMSAEMKLYNFNKAEKNKCNLFIVLLF